MAWLSYFFKDMFELFGLLQVLCNKNFLILIFLVGFWESSRHWNFSWADLTPCCFAQRSGSPCAASMVPPVTSPSCRLLRAHGKGIVLDALNLSLKCLRVDRRVACLQVFLT